MVSSSVLLFTLIGHNMVFMSPPCQLYHQFIAVKQVFFHYQEGSLADHCAYKPYTLVGPPAL